MFKRRQVRKIAQKIRKRKKKHIPQEQCVVDHEKSRNSSITINEIPLEKIVIGSSIKQDTRKRTLKYGMVHDTIKQSLRADLLWDVYATVKSLPVMLTSCTT